MSFTRAGLGLIRIKLSERVSELSNKNKKVKFVAGHTDGTDGKSRRMSESSADFEDGWDWDT